MNEQQHKLMLDWMRKVHQMEYAHRYDSTRWNTRERWIGALAFILATLATFSYQFPAVSSVKYDGIFFLLKREYFVPIVSTLVAVLTGMQTFLKPGEKSDIHKRLANDYERLRHKIEVAIVVNPDTIDFANQVEVIRSEWEGLDAINVSNCNFKKAKNRVTLLGKYPEELGFL